ncbi:putative RNA-directed DNA polymerase from transposon BS [Stylophora pistillata]|uniref:Putative RNA-directed DNA polymerase from transposon BS n=1 Tax=Stylophora pistillata TaxID=50429 RepID=A0A2B4RVF4_STYPI|nr:putative RNA-directed DNA polymerase from transposon BS [Stylophora pistillata]
MSWWRGLTLFFCDLTSSFTPIVSSDVANITVTEIPDELYVSESEAYKALASTKIKKASGSDDLPSVILKVFAFELAPVVDNIYNATLKDGLIPPLLKCAIVHPIPKQTPPKSIEDDIRPVSLTCQLAKVFEGFTLTRVLPTVLKDLDIKQLAVSGKSTEQAIIYLLHLALEALDKGNCSIRWIASFLHERSQVTRIGTTFSRARTLRGGVPQGTKPGPLLFAVMVDDLVSAWAPRAKYVDDLTVIEIIPTNSPSVLNYIVNDINSYACQNNMRLNPRKCKVLTVDFLLYNSCVPMPIMVGGSLVEQVPSFKLLGVHVSEDLTWTVHIDWLVKRANRRMFALRQLRKCGVPPKDIVAVYCALVRSILEYASAVFADLPKYLDNALEDVQKRALSIIWPDLLYDHTLEKAAIQSLSARRAAACERFIRKIRPGHPLYPHIHERIRKRCPSSAMLDLVYASSLLYRFQMEGLDVNVGGESCFICGSHTQIITFWDGTRTNCEVSREVGLTLCEAFEQADKEHIDREKGNERNRSNDRPIHGAGPCLTCGVKSETDS